VGELLKAVKKLTRKRRRRNDELDARNRVGAVDAGALQETVDRFMLDNGD
jgi:hypothetical protein